MIASAWNKIAFRIEKLTLSLTHQLRCTSKNCREIWELRVRRKGNLRLFTLNNNFAVRELKKAYYAILLKELGIEKIAENCISLAIYVASSGDFDEKSDLDIS